MLEYDIVIIGGGTGGLAAAISAKEKGINKILILETDSDLGGVLRQCIHTGFGLHTFQEELTGPEFAQRFIDKVNALKIEYKLNTPVLEISKEKIITAISKDDGYLEIKAKSIIIATGCRERAAGAINIAGSRPAGVLTAGTAQRYINLEGYMVGKRIVILGSGDIGLIMARRLTLEGASVLCVAEIMPYSNGLNRNIVQCLQDFGIPLYLSHTVTKIIGRSRVEGVVLSEVDAFTKKPVLGSEKYFACDTLLLSVGLIPEGEIARDAGVTLTNSGGVIVNEYMESNISGIFACGNVVQVHDIVDFVALEGEKAGRNAADYINGDYTQSKNEITTRPLEGVGSIVPQRINAGTANTENEDLELSFRVNHVFKNAEICLYADKTLVYKYKKKHMAPGEMEKLKINKNKFSGCHCRELSLQVRSDELD
jgi:NADPH-dependent 2,4-dienoyl-CoA reductase/sulfur reductase-like enzyme